MKKFYNYHNIVLTVSSIIEEYIQDKNWFFWQQKKLGMYFFFDFKAHLAV